MKKNLRNSLKNWVKKIKWIEYELMELEDELHTYESNMFYYRSPSFEPRISSNSFYQSNLDFWIDKIIKIEDKINNYKKEIKNYNKFIEKLITKEKILFESYYIKELPNKECMKEAGTTQYMFYYYMDKILIKYYNNV